MKKFGGASIRWSQYKELSELLDEYEDYSLDAVLRSGVLKKGDRDKIVQNISDLATKIQEEIDKILQV